MWPGMRKVRVGQHFGLHWAGRIGVWVLLGSTLGCTPLARPEVEPLLRQPRMSPDSIVLDVFLVRFPPGDLDMNGTLWQEIDEQPFPADVRRLLLANGFRAGVLAGELPGVLAERLELADNQPLPGGMTQLKIDELAQQPAVLRGHFQLRDGAPKEFALGPIREKLDVLVRDAHGDVSGKPYEQVQLLLTATAHPMGDGRVRLALVPEITYGEYRQNWTANGQGVLRLAPGRQSRAFDTMKLDAVLSPGHVLVLSMVPTQPGSLGGHFFTEPSGDQRMLLVRLSQTQHDGAFDREADLVIE